MLTSYRPYHIRSCAALLLAACAGGERPPGGAAAVPGAAERAAAPSPASTPRMAAPRDPVPLTAAVELDGKRYAFSGLGECQYTSEASIYEVPATMWSSRFGSDEGGLNHVNLTLWQPKGAGDLQISLSVTTGTAVSQIATVKGADPHGRGQATAAGDAPGVLRVTGTDGDGRAVRLEVQCSRYTEPVAEGG